jgi:hypothetical protein
LPFFFLHFDFTPAYAAFWLTIRKFAPLLSKQLL